MIGLFATPITLLPFTNSLVQDALVDAALWAYNNPSEAGHLFLDAVGLVPGLGEAADAINSIWYSLEGDTSNAALSLAAAAPIVGWFSTGGKYFSKVTGALPVTAFQQITSTIGTFVGDTLTGAQKLLADQSGAIDVTALYDGMEWIVAKFTGWGPFGRGIAPKTVKDFPGVGTKTSQKQLRHINGRPEYRGGGYFDNAADAQSVLDAFHSGDATIIGTTSQGFPVVRYGGVTGTNVNVSAGFPNQPTNVFIIKGTASPSVVPANPKWGG